jgi:phytoene dehydrogenase-like protein
VVGGAAVTEEIVPGFKFSRASYVLSLLRPKVLNELELKKHGLKIILRDPNSFTPVLDPKSGHKSLTLGRSSTENAKQIAQFSVKDAEAYNLYGEQMMRVVEALDPLLDTTPLHAPSWIGPNRSFIGAWKNWTSLKALMYTGIKLGRDVLPFYEFLTAPSAKVLNRWFECDPLKASLSTDSVVGAMTSPYLPGSGYVLLHHVMGDIDGQKGIWAYVEGGMGSVSKAIANCAQSHGASIFTNKPIKQILVNGDRKAEGVVLEDGMEIRSQLVLSNATAKVTFIDLLEQSILPADFKASVKAIDYTSPVTKINVAVKQLPNFLAIPNSATNQPMPHHRGSLHLNCHSMDMIHRAYLDAAQGTFSQRPLIEMTIPSSLDPTLAPYGCHVVQMFTQFTPYHLAGGREWTEELKNEYANVVFDWVEQYAPGFKASIIGKDILTPPDLEKIFGLTGGNIFHGAMSLDQLYFCRPVSEYSNYQSPISGLFLCGSGAHPGGGVMGAPGRLAALSALRQLKSAKN